MIVVYIMIGMVLLGIFLHGLEEEFRRCDKNHGGCYTHDDE